MTARAVIFDLDGTLVDSNDAHVRAWCAALDSAGMRLPAGRVAPEIGKGGDRLIPSLLGEQLEPGLIERLRGEAARAFGELARSSSFPVMPAVTELLARLRAQGIATAVASSASQHDLQLVLASSGLQLDSLVDAVISGDDADQTKPRPDVIATAVAKLGVHPAQCVVVGDTPHDALAAVRAGTAFVGVASGYHDPEALRASGAREAFGSVSQLLERYEDFLRAAFPLGELIEPGWIDELLTQALHEATRGLEEAEVPIGAVVADRDGRVVARAHERIQGLRNMTSHAVISALLSAGGRRIGFGGHEVVIATTVEPCRMCVAGAMEARADLVVYGMGTGLRGGHELGAGWHGGGWMPRLVGGVRQEQCRRLLEQWLAMQAHRESRHHRFVRELLGAEHK